MPIPSGLALVEDKWRLDNPARQVGQALTGRRQVVANPTPLWRAEITFRVTYGDPHFAAEAWVESLRGGAVIDQIQPGAQRMTFPIAGGITYDGGTTFDGGVTYDATPYARLTAAATVLATSVQVDSGSIMKIGRFIWIGDRMYRVTAISGSAVSIQPPLREAAAKFARVYGNKTIPMVLADPETGDLRRTAEGSTDMTITFLEAL